MKSQICLTVCLCLFFGFACSADPLHPPNGQLEILHGVERTTEHSAEQFKYESAREKPSMDAHLADSTPSSESLSSDIDAPDIQPSESKADDPQSEIPKDEMPIPEQLTPDIQTQKWIGAPCSVNRECNYPGGICLQASSGFPNGLCSQSCTGLCPDRPGEPTTFCIADSNQKGICVQQCSKSVCRRDYVCVIRNRFKQHVTKQVCVPKPTSSQNSKRILMVGDSQSSGTSFAKVMVSFFRAPKTVCSTAQTSNNQVFSYAKVSSAARHWSETKGSSKNWLCRATRIYTNGTTSTHTTGVHVCKGILNQTRSIFEALVALHQPDVFLIQLGGNSAGFSESYVKSRTLRLLNQIPAGRTCFWIAPTHTAAHLKANRVQVVRWIRDTLQRATHVHCTLLESMEDMAKQTSCSSFNVSDGLHMTRCGSDLWGRFTRNQLCSQGGL